MFLASGAGVAGAVLMLAGVGDGPHLTQKARFDARIIWKVFRHRPFRFQAFGYFGHMWELYAFWSLLGYYLETSLSSQGASHAGVPISLLVFFAIGMGAVGCVAGGWVSRTVGERRVALVSLVVSATLCLAAGFIADFIAAARCGGGTSSRRSVKCSFPLASVQR